jgi:hypothetical protein
MALFCWAYSRNFSSIGTIAASSLCISSLSLFLLALAYCFSSSESSLATQPQAVTDRVLKCGHILAGQRLNPGLLRVTITHDFSSSWLWAAKANHEPTMSLRRKQRTSMAAGCTGRSSTHLVLSHDSLDGFEKSSGHYASVDLPIAIVRRRKSRRIRLTEQPADRFIAMDALDRFAQERGNG